MTMDFYKYLFMLNQSKGIGLIINLFIFLVSLITLVYNNRNFVNAMNDFNLIMLFLVGYSLFNATWSMIEKYKEIQEFIGKNKLIEMTTKTNLVKDEFVFQLDKINSEKRGNWLFENFSPDSTSENRVVRSEDLNNYLWDYDFELKKDDGTREKKIKKFIIKNREIITPFFQYKYYNSKRKNQNFFNETKLCMSSDINPKRSYVSCHKSNYYNSFLTNEISTSVLKRIEDATIIYDASNFYPCEYNRAEDKYYLQSIDKSEMNNHIGASTLAVTDDNYLVIRKQGAGTQQNINKYVPTGSGSCNWSDIKEGSFRSTIEYSMKRELWEENGGRNHKSGIDEFAETKLLGYFRWLKRGGKPEFVGISKLNCSLDQLTPDHNELIDMNSKADTDTFYLESVDDLPKVIKEIKQIGNTSLPLLMSLDALKQFYQHRRDELDQLLKLG